MVALHDVDEICEY